MANTIMDTIKNGIASFTCSANDVPAIRAVINRLTATGGVRQPRFKLNTTISPICIRLMS